jgi:3-hydroxybutyryl-CoA dehydrogenase
MVRGIEAVEAVGVVGAGTMGAGVAQVAATAGFDVVMRDLDESLLEDAFDRVEDSLDRLVDRGTFSETEAREAIDRIDGTTAVDDLVDADLVVEAVVEEMDVKREVFGTLDELLDDDVVLATNTSTLSITALGAATDRPELVVGLHFFNPAPIMPGLEIVVGEHTGDETVAVAEAFASAIGKDAWESDDKPGFVVNRILIPWINEGIRAYDEGVASKEDVDRAMELGTNVPMGPLELADFVGLDICLHAAETLHEELGERYRPPYLLRRRVDAGDLGRKSGRGFYEYD